MIGLCGLWNLHQFKLDISNALNTVRRQCLLRVRMEVVSSRPDQLPTLSAAKTSELSLLVKLPFWWRSGRFRQCSSDFLLLRLSASVCRRCRGWQRWQWNRYGLRRPKPRNATSWRLMRRANNNNNNTYWVLSGWVVLTMRDLSVLHTMCCPRWFQVTNHRRPNVV